MQAFKNGAKDFLPSSSKERDSIQIYRNTNVLTLFCVKEKKFLSISIFSRIIKTITLWSLSRLLKWLCLSLALIFHLPECLDIYLIVCPFVCVAVWAPFFLSAWEWLCGSVCLSVCFCFVSGQNCLQDSGLSSLQDVSNILYGTLV